jgi:predicted dehydrogenase
MMIRAGILGSGWMATEHAHALRGFPGVELVGVASGSQERARKFASDLGEAQAYESYRHLIESEAVDVIHVCTQNTLHHGQTLLALQTGKHVVAEKPLAISTHQSRELLDVALASDRVHACNYTYRAYPAVQEARRLFRSGELGDLYIVRGTYLQDWLLFAEDYNWRLDPAASGPSSAMADIGTHWFDLIEHITAERVVSLEARLRTAVPERIERTPNGDRRHRINGDDAGVVGFEMASGALGSVVVSQVSAGRKNHLTFELNCARASIHWSQEEPDRLWIGRRDEASTLRMRDSAMSAEVDLPPGHPFGWRDAFQRNLESFYAGIRGEPPAVPFATFADGHRSMDLLEAILKSSAEHSQVVTPHAADALHPTH